MMAKKSAKKCAAFSQFLFCLLNQLLFQILFWFPHFRCRCSCAELASSRYHTKQFLMCNDFAWKTKNLIEKCATKSTSTGTHTDRFKISWSCLSTFLKPVLMGRALITPNKAKQSLIQFLKCFRWLLTTKTSRLGAEIEMWLNKRLIKSLVGFERKQ